MYALRERRVHVTQEDFELAVAKVRSENTIEWSIQSILSVSGNAKRFGEERFIEKTLEVIKSISFYLQISSLLNFSVCYHSGKTTNKSRETYSLFSSSSTSSQIARQHAH